MESAADTRTATTAPLKIKASILESMRTKSTPELFGIWHTNDRHEWSGEAFEAVFQVLMERNLVPPPQGAPALPKFQYQGVKGWLLFLCVSLVVLRPLLGFIGAALFIASGRLFFGGLLLAISAFSIYAGVGLWRVAPHAIQRAKRFLWANLIAEGAVVAFAYSSSTIDSGQVRETLGAIVYFCVWYSYLSSSKRVRDTYYS